ncbi:MAG: winged helix-turn-helix transcriptional regulator [Nanoarchaeota archaeon]
MRIYFQTISSQIVKLDLKDRKLLYQLGQNSRIPHTLLAKKIGLSKDAISYRIQRLTKAGVIQGNITVIDINRLGFTTYHLFIKLHTPTKENRQTVINSLSSYPFIKAVIEYSGRYDLEVSLIARNIEELEAEMATIVHDVGIHLETYELLILTKTLVSRALPQSFHKEPATKPMEREEALPDEKDLHLLSALAENANIPFYELGKAIGLTGEAASYRMKKLIKGGIIEAFRPIINFAALGQIIYCVPLDIRNLDQKKIKELSYFLDNNSHTLWSAKTIGAYNLILYLCVNEPDQLHQTIISLREQFDVKDYETLIAYQDHKYTYFPESLHKI